MKCIGDIGIPKCSLAKKVINFGLIPIGITKTQTIKVKNTGDDDAIFSLSYSYMTELEVLPMNGRIPAHDSQVFQVNFKSVHSSAFDIPVTIHIAGANPLSFNVQGQSEFPRVQIVQNEGDLHFFSQINHESANALHFRLNRPPIKKLIRMRYAMKTRITSDDDETGWYNIESENNQTLTMEEVSSTYQIDSNAWTNKHDNSADENKVLSREAFSAEKFRELANGARFSKASSNKYKAYAKTELPLEINTPFLRPASDTSSGTIQLLKTQSAPGTATSYGEEGSQRIIPTRSSSSSGRRGRRSQEDEQQN